MPREGAAICGNQAAALAGRGPDPRPPHASAKFKRSAPDPRAPSAEICDQKITISEVIFLGRCAAASVATGREPYMRRVLGDAWRLLWSRIFFGRRFSQIGNADRARIFFIVGWRFLTRIGTSACFAAAGFPRIDSAGDYRWLR